MAANGAIDDGPVLAIGQLLCAPPFLDNRSTVLGEDHSFPLPSDPALVGKHFSIQGVTVSFNPLVILLHSF